MARQLSGASGGGHVRRSGRGGRSSLAVLIALGAIGWTRDGTAGQTYTMTPASWSSGTATRQWYREALDAARTRTAIPGATGLTYVAQPSDAGYRLACVETNGAATAEAVAPVKRMLVGAYGGMPDTSSVSTTQNSFNASLARVALQDIINVRPAFTGFRVGVSSEADYDNAVTYRAQIQVGGTSYDCGSTTVQPGAVLVEAPQFVPFIARGTAYTVRIYGSVGTGGKIYLTDRYRNDAAGQGAEWGSNLPDRTSGTFTPQNILLPSGFVGCMADVAQGSRLVVRTGDSLMSQDNGLGYLNGKVDWFAMSRNGAQVWLLNGNYAKRAQFMTSIGATDAMCDGGVNDINANGRTQAQVETAIATLAGTIRNAGVSRVHWATICPCVDTTANPATDTSQTIRANFVNGRRQAVNASLRAGAIGNVDAVLEWARAVEHAANDGWWTAGSCGDGLHPLPAGQSAINQRMAADETMRL